MSDAQHVVMINGETVSPDRAFISVYDRGFLYGDSVFEVLRTYDGVPFAVDEHVERLFASAARVFIHVPVSPADLREEILHATAQSKTGNNVVRVHVTRGVAPLGLDPTEANCPMRVVLVEPVKPPPASDYCHGIAVSLARTERVTDHSSAAGAKVANYLVSLLALREAFVAGAKEAIIVDGRGRVLEGTSSNVFVVKDGVLMTPPDTEGILPGITRRYLLQAAETLEVPIRITTITTGDLLTGDEAFVSSTVREVLPVVRVDNEPIGDGQVGTLTRALHQRFRKLGKIPGPMPWDVEPSSQRGSNAHKA